MANVSAVIRYRFLSIMFSDAIRSSGTNINRLWTLDSFALAVVSNGRLNRSVGASWRYWWKVVKIISV